MMQFNLFSWLGGSATRLALFASLCLFACSGNIPNSDSNEVAQESLTTAVYQIDCGGGAVSPFAADQFATGGTVATWANAITTAGVANAAPAAVYQTERYGNHSYTFPGLTPGASYTARLHFTELKFTTSGARQFNVLINGVQVLTNLDVFATVGINKALVLDFSTTASSSGLIAIQYVNVVNNAKSSAIEILSTSTAPSNQAPTVATAAAANSNPTTGTTTALSVLGADDGGEANLTYRWATSGTPPGAVSFSANASNAAKNTTATFSQAGSYTLVATMQDASGATVTSSVTVAVNQKLTSVSATPGTAQVAPNGTQQFAASARDQFGSPMAATYTWAVSAGGTINASGVFTAGSTSGGPFAVTATSAGISGGAGVTVAGGAPPSTTPVYQIDCGGGAVSPFAADQFATGGTVATWANAITTAGVTNAAPAAVYQTERYGNHSYTFPGLTPGASYTARLHFAELKFTANGARQFNVLINGVQVLTNLDIFATVGINKALVLDFSTTASSSGLIAIQYVNVVNNAKSSAIEILSTSAAPNNQAPTVATAAAANSNPTTGTTTALSVLGADDGGEVNLTYRWATSGTPPGAVSFSANASNAAKNTTATFSQAGSYTLVATMQDASGATVTSTVTVAVNQKLTSVSVTPGTAQVTPNGTQQFAASARDQFGNPMAATYTWAVSGGGTINASGLFTAGSASGGPFAVTATSAGINGGAGVTVTGGAPPVTYSTNFNLTESPISEGGAWRNNGLDWTKINTANGFAYGTQTSPSGTFDDSYAYLSGFPPNQSASAVIHLDPAISSSSSHEVEILLRWADSAHVARGYECNIAYNGNYTEIVRWNGARGSFTYLSQPGAVSGGVHDGDVLSARMVGSVITVFLNGRQINSATDSTWTDGNPGMALYHGNPAGVFAGDFAFTSFSATSVTQ